MIKLENLDCGFDHPVIKNINLALKKSEVLILLGPNGAGKSCLLLTMTGAIPPIGGSLSGVSSDARKRVREVSYASQEAIRPDLQTVQSYLDLISPANNVSEVISTLELNDYLSRSLNKLSGGERQRARLAATLIQDSETYLLDEPTTSLDPRPIEKLCSLIKAMSHKGKTFVIVTHDLNFACALGDRFVGVKENKISFDCNKDELRTSNHLDSLFERRFNWSNPQGEQWFAL